MHGMISRAMIAVLDHNCSAILPQATTSDGNLRKLTGKYKVGKGFRFPEILN